MITFSARLLKVMQKGAARASALYKVLIMRLL